MVELLQAKPSTSLETGSEIGYELPGFEGLASLVIDQRRKLPTYSGNETGTTIDIDELLRSPRAVSAGWNRADWEPVTARASESVEGTALTHPSRRMEWATPRKRGRRISLREAWELAGRVFEEAEARRQKSREIEAREFFGSPDDEPK